MRAPMRNGWSSPRRTRIDGRSSRAKQWDESDTALGEPAASFLVAEDDGVLTRLQHNVEVAAADWILRPPTVDDAPLFPDHGHRLPVHLPRRTVEIDVHDRRSRLV